MAKFNLVGANTNKDVENIEKDLTEQSKLKDGQKVGRIIDLDMKDIEKDGACFTYITVIINAKKIYEKSFTVDFLRKFLTQFEISGEDLLNKVVVFSLGRYNKVIGLHLLNRGEDGDELVHYVDEHTTDVLQKLKKLGL